MNTGREKKEENESNMAVRHYFVFIQILSLSSVFSVKSNFPGHSIYQQYRSLVVIEMCTVSFLIWVVIFFLFFLSKVPCGLQ